jgi:hypothetical protein
MSNIFSLAPQKNLRARADVVIVADLKHQLIIGNTGYQKKMFDNLKREEKE